MQAVIRSFTHRFSWLLILSLVLTSVFQMQTVQATSDLENGVNSSLKKTVKYYYKSNRKYDFNTFDWELIGLSAAGEKLATRKWQDKAGKTAIDTWAGKAKDIKDAGSLAKLSIGLIHNGYDPTNFNGINLLERIADSQEKNGKMGDDTYTVFNHVLSILALEMYEYPYDRKKATQFLLERYDDFNLIDEDAFTLNALSLLEDQDGVEEAKKAILEKLEKEQQDDGSFISYGSASLDSTIQVLIGLTTIGEDVFAEPWNKSVEFLLANQMADGGFQALWQPGSSNAFTTENALIALATVREGNSLFQVLTDKEKAALKVYVPVVDLSKQVKVYDGLDNFLSGKEVKQAGNTFSINGKQLLMRVNVEGIAKEEKPVAVMVKVMKGADVVDVAMVESNSSAAQNLTAGFTLASGTYTVEINYWYGLADKPEVAKESITFVASVK
ncbi:hypothetical protein [Brevibacillus sp. SYSU BS000544]|uniref:hypothetical protein n=1 Tax=Brevibacillus sp. SYSU BS000544 TaxID=3416443 RepID=UPI003CE4A9EA